MNVAVAASLLLGAAQAAGAAQRGAAGSPGWRAVQVLHKPGKYLVFAAVATAGTKHAWAGGAERSLKVGAITPLLEQWNGSAWSAVSLPGSSVSKLALP